DVRAAAGAGGVLDDDALLARVGFDAGWLRGQRLRADMLSVISVQGDSMEPTLAAGDDILVDRSDGAARLRDGIYVLRADDGLLVKRIAVNALNRRIIIRSDNPAYPDWPDCAPGDVGIIGRVVWVGRRLG
ncbi:MAG: helix-turn-helix transcriptional regulator, partial [Alphaproteobacteria bacterium]|nr:helix-turn-helix transcriptional regulator [Alphaproteobacteria bacterium]